jgi:hypothetical protein
MIVAILAAAAFYFVVERPLVEALQRKLIKGRTAELDTVAP